MTSSQQPDDAKSDLVSFLRSSIDRHIQDMADGSAPAQTVTNPFTGEKTTLRARPVHPALVELQSRLAGKKGKLLPQDRELLRRVFAYVALHAVSALASSAAGEGETFGDIDLIVTDGAGERMHENLHSLIPSPEEVVPG